MAIIDSFEVKVLVDGEECPEYADDESEDTANFRSTYIEAIPGTQFEVQLEIMPGFDFGRANYVRWEINLDGNSIIKPLCHKPAYQREGYWVDTKGGLREQQDGIWYERKFQFSPAAIREAEPDDTYHEVLQLSKVLGAIRVIIRRRVGGPKRDLHREPAQFHGMVPEKAVKGQAITLAPSLGAAEVSEKITYHEGEDVDAEPVAEFVFKYRTKKALKQLMVIPRTPSPEPLEERPLEDLTAEELLELARRQKDLLETHKMAKREDQEDEAQARRERSTTIDNDEVVEIASPSGQEESAVDG